MYIEWVWIVDLGGKWECNPTQLNDGRNTILIEWALRLFSEYAKYVNFVAHIQWWRATILTRTTTTTAYHINIAVEWTLPQLYATNRKFGHRQRYFSNIKFEYSWICFYFICRYSALKTASLIFVYSRHDFLSSAESKELFFLLCCANKFKSNILCVNRHSLLMFDILDEWRKRTPWAPHRWNWKWNGIKWNEKKIFSFDHKHEHRTKTHSRPDPQKAVSLWKLNVTAIHTTWWLATDERALAMVHDVVTVVGHNEMIILGEGRRWAGRRKRCASIATGLTTLTLGSHVECRVSTHVLECPEQNEFGETESVISFDDNWIYVLFVFECVLCCCFSVLFC